MGKRTRGYREAEVLPAEEMRGLLIEWRRRQNLVVRALLEFWRRASPAVRSGLWWQVVEGEGPKYLTDRDGKVLAKVSYLPSGEPVLVWAVSAGTMQRLADDLRELLEAA